VTRAEPFEPVELAPGLWRWTAPHPEWREGAAVDSSGDWDRDVGSVLLSHQGATTFIDALVPANEAAFWRWADEQVDRNRRCAALTTIKFHRRSRDRIVERYGASTSRARDKLPPGVEKLALRGAGEVCFWIAAHRALVPGDRVLGGRGGGLRLCPESWLAYLGNGLTRSGLGELLRPLLELPIERVLVSHGEPVLHDGRTALRAAIE
jgi:hypothetical protein